MTIPSWQPVFAYYSGIIPGKLQPGRAATILARRIRLIRSTRTCFETSL